MARAPDFDLAKELAKPSFTPAQRDAPALVELVIADHEKAAAAVAGLGEAGRRALEARLAAEDAGDATHAGGALDEASRARIVGALGLLARAGDAAARATVLARLADPGVRVRRAAISALGKLAPLAAPDPAAVDEARTALLAHWDAHGEAAPAPADEKRTLVEALGKLGGPEVQARLAALAPGADAELARRRDRARLMADRDAGRAAPSAIVTSAGGLARWPLRLHCKGGMGPLLAEELAVLGMAVTARDDAWVETRCERYDELFRSRLWSYAGIRVPLARAAAADASTERGADARAIVATLTGADVRGLLRAMTTGAIRWRLNVPSGHRRALVWQVARDVGAAAPELVNDPSQTTWDVHVDAGDGRDPSHGSPALELVPRRIDDPRFTWRVAEVPAASHPTVAAALAFVAGARANDRVWDPFCGSGAELVERARLGPCTLLGTDVDDEALAAARANLAAAHAFVVDAGVTATLANADARTHAPGPQDLIITNPPLGSRVQVDATALLTAALPGFARALAPGGRLVWITPGSRKTTPVAEQLGLVRTRDVAIDLGGVRGRLERWQRPGP